MAKFVTVNKRWWDWMQNDLDQVQTRCDEYKEALETIFGDKCFQPVNIEECRQIAGDVLKKGE